MYIKLMFTYMNWRVPQAGGGCRAYLNAKPSIVATLPINVQADTHCERQQKSNHLGENFSFSTYYHDCTGLIEADVEKALEAFNCFYANHKQPFAEVLSYKDEHINQNEIVTNLKIAVTNIRNGSEELFLNERSNKYYTV